MTKIRDWLLVAVLLFVLTGPQCVVVGLVWWAGDMLDRHLSP